MASASDLFKKATNNFSTTLSSNIGSTDTTIPLTSVTNLPTDTGIVLVIDRVDSSGNLTPTAREYVKGVISGNNLINVVRGVGGSSGLAHTSGAVVESVPDQVTQNDMVTGIVTEHNQDGTHQAGIIKTSYLSTTVQGGWFSTSATLTYTSWDSTNKTGVVGSNTDLTSLISVGQRLAITQTTVKYFIVTAITSSAITLYGGTDYTLANATITSPKYSPWKAPVGFPLDPAKWTQTFTDTTQRSQSSPVTNTWYNLGSQSLSIPIGSWNVRLKVRPEVTKSAAGATNVYVTLSTANNSESDNDWTSNQSISNGTDDGATVFQQRPITVTSATTYYLNTRTTAASMLALYNQNAVIASLIEAVCAYL